MNDMSERHRRSIREIQRSYQLEGAANQDDSYDAVDSFGNIQLNVCILQTVQNIRK